MLRLADTSIRLYRKKDWSVAVRLHSYLMIHCERKSGFLLSEYLNQLECAVTLDDGRIVELDDYSYTESSLHAMGHMIHEFWATGSTKMDTIRDSAALLQIEYRLFSFLGQGEAVRFQTVAPVLARGKRSDRSAKKKPTALSDIKAFRGKA
ncbi:MAG: hypothetical protein KA260_12295 [Burkholderiales bacterium]|nr:hypothetical protein [Burkholderiales bacterium]